MINDDLYLNTRKSRDFYKGKSMDFAGEWKPGVTYFNDDYITNFVVYTEENIGSVLLCCRQSHIAKEDKFTQDLKSNQPHIKCDANGGIVGIQPNPYWNFVCGSLKGVKGDKGDSSYIIVNNADEANGLLNDQNLGKLVYRKDNGSLYEIKLIDGNLGLHKILFSEDLDGLRENVSELEDKLSGIEDNAQKNKIEQIILNGTPLEIINKTVTIDFPNIPHVPQYTLRKLTSTDPDYIASYALCKDGVDLTDTYINIPKDKYIVSATHKQVITNGEPYEGAKIGDYYIEMVIQNGTSLYIPIQSMVVVYTAGQYIIIEDNTISVDFESLMEAVKQNITINVSQIADLEEDIAELVETSFTWQ